MIKPAAHLRRAFCGTLLIASMCYAQPGEEAGHSIGKISIQGNLIVLELDDGILGKANLFDLNGRTLLFTASGSGYRVKNKPLNWDPDYGAELKNSQVTLHQFAFPFSRKSWRSIAVGMTGSIRFGVPENEPAVDPYGHHDAGVVLGRFDQLAEVAGNLGDKGPSICVFLKPRLSGPRYVKELADRLVITWDLTEPSGSYLDFSWFKTVNQFQAVLHSNGSIEMSYKEVSAKDGIVGIYAGASAEKKALPVHFSALSPKDEPLTSIYEAFHYLRVPMPQDLSCTVIKALGDKFDFLVYYSDFRVDSQEASSPSDGPIGGNITGIGHGEYDQTPQLLASRCTQGRFQLSLAQPVYVGANEMQEGPPAGAPVGGIHDITAYSHELAEGSVDGRGSRYNYAVGHLGHEVGHRWSAYVSAKINGKTIPLGAWPHWATGLQARVAFPYSLPLEASTIGGGVWQDNQDGTYTQLRDGFFVPAAGYSYLDLYLMGLISAAEVPDFFILNSLVRVRKDSTGHAVFRAERTKMTVQDVIAAEGPRSPDVDHSQRKFNTGFVVMVEHGRSPSRELLERANGVRSQWIEYWRIATGRRAEMRASPR